MDLTGAEIIVKVSTLGSGRAQRALIRAERIWVIEKKSLRKHYFGLQCNNERCRGSSMLP